jgi:glutathione peroxidase
MRTLLALAAVLALAALPASAQSLYDLKVNSLDGKPADLAQYKGHVVLVVNVASHCGFTKQYKGLEALYTKYQGQGFFILGFPSNDFKGQEPGTPEQIQQFCTATYGVTFPLFEKVDVLKTLPTQSPVYQFLTAKNPQPSWNFCKYLIDKNGQVLQFYPSKVTPEDKQLTDAIEAALKS